MTTNIISFLLAVGAIATLCALTPGVIGQPPASNASCNATTCLNGGVCSLSSDNSTVRCDCTGTGFTGLVCGVPYENNINECDDEAVAGLLWEQPFFGATVNQACSAVNDNLKSGLVKRTCTDGVWSSVDYSQCLLDGGDAFMLLWIPLDVDNVTIILDNLPTLTTDIFGLLGVNRSLHSLKLKRTIEVLSLSSPYISATFELELPMKVPSAAILSLLSETVALLNSSVTTMLGGVPVAVDAPFGAQGFYESDSCYCQQPEMLFLGLCEQIIPVPACTCFGSNGTCECFFPYFIGDGVKCTVDEDGDGFPNIPLDFCDEMNITNSSYCIADNCVEHFNPDQDITKCVAPPGFVGCPIEEDEVWEVHWGNTLKGETDRQRCPQGPGFTTRLCGPNGWEPAVARQCGSYRFSSLEDDLQAAFDDDDLENQLLSTAGIFEQIRAFTQPGGTVSILPFDLGSTNSIVEVALELLEEIQEGEIIVDIPDFNVVDVLSNVLAGTNLNGWIALQEVGAGSQQLLDNAERYALYLSQTIDDDDKDRRSWQRENLVIGFNNANPDDDADHTFPQSEDEINGTFSNIPAQISVPQSFLREQMATGRRSVPVSSIIFRNMEQALPTKKETVSVASMVLSAQVAGRKVASSTALESNPVVMSFTFDAVENATSYKCAFWEFSNPVGSGTWRTGGVEMMSKETSADGSKVTVFCNATHLTSFAVLVDVSGTLNPGDNNTGVTRQELQALQIVSYIGCAISLVCLAVTIVFFVIMGKELLRKVHYFIHLNLAITLFLAYLMFVVGVEPARASVGACVFVAAWLHYFFLSSFSWMLCEGIMLYLMLVVVFSKLSKRWWFFLLLGYGLPVVPVVVTLGARTSDYGVTDSNGTLQYCWLSTDNGVIWGFVGPMLVIILVNVVFMVVALVTVYRSTHRTVKRRKSGMNSKDGMNMKDSKMLFKKLFIATMVLLPILGITWILGVFTVNANTTVFAWLFTIFNSLQGLFIFFFHVLRSDKIWKSTRATSFRTSISTRITVRSSSSISKKDHPYALERGTTTDLPSDKLTSISEKGMLEMDEFTSTMTNNEKRSKVSFASEGDVKDDIRAMESGTASTGNEMSAAGSPESEADDVKVVLLPSEISSTNGDLSQENTTL